MGSRAKTVTWHSSETDEAGLMADLDGITGSIEPAEEGRWLWNVRPSGKRSEFPELYAAGNAASVRGAQRSAEAAMRKADKEYGHPFADEDAAKEIVDAMPPLTPEVEAQLVTLLAPEPKAPQYEAFVGGGGHLYRYDPQGDRFLCQREGCASAVLDPESSSAYDSPCQDEDEAPAKAVPSYPGDGVGDGDDDLAVAQQDATVTAFGEGLAAAKALGDAIAGLALTAAQDPKGGITRLHRQGCKALATRLNHRDATLADLDGTPGVDDALPLATCCKPSKRAIANALFTGRVMDALVANEVEAEARFTGKADSRTAIDGAVSRDLPKRGRKYASRKSGNPVADRAQADAAMVTASVGTVLALYPQGTPAGDAAPARLAAEMDAEAARLAASKGLGRAVAPAASAALTPAQEALAATYEGQGYAPAQAARMARRVQA